MRLGEAPYLREWIAHYRRIGATRFFLYDNGSTDDGGIVAAAEGAEVVVWPGRAQQMKVYEAGCKAAAGEVDWLVVVDVDEFMYHPSGASLPEVLAPLERFSQVWAPWRMFGWRPHDRKPPGGTVENYLWRAPDDSPVHAHGKAVVRPERVGSWPDPHFASVGGHTTHGTSGLLVNHYWTRSREEAFAKFARGRADTGTVRAWDEVERAAPALASTQDLRLSRLALGLPSDYAPPPTPDPKGSCSVCNRIIRVSHGDRLGRCGFCRDKEPTAPPPPGLPPVRDVRGWFHFEPRVLALLARVAPAQAVEVGTFMGRSAIPQALLLQRWGGFLTCVDTFEGGADLSGLPRHVIERSERECRENLIRYGCHNAEVLRLASVDAARRWWEEGRPRPGFVYVDAAHDYANVSADLRAWWALLLPGGIMAGDDYGSADFPDVARAWNDFADAAGLELRTSNGRDNPGLVWVERA
jgi:hypothetical protein